MNKDIYCFQKQQMESLNEKSWPHKASILRIYLVFMCIGKYQSMFEKFKETDQNKVYHGLIDMKQLLKAPILKLFVHTNAKLVKITSR